MSNKRTVVLKGTPYIVRLLDYHELIDVSIGEYIMLSVFLSNDTDLPVPVMPPKTQDDLEAELKAAAKVAARSLNTSIQRVIELTTVKELIQIALWAVGVHTDTVEQVFLKAELQNNNLPCV